MTIDFHTHLLPPSFGERADELRRRDATFAALFARGDARMATAADLLAAMERDGIETSVAVGYGWCDGEVAREANDYLLEAQQRHPGRIVAFCSVDPGWGDGALREAERCLDAGARGIGELHPSSQRTPLPDGAGVAELMRLASERGAPVLVHGSEPVGHAYPGKGETHPAQLIALAERYPETTFVFAHWGGGLPFYALMPEVRGALANAYVDTAASPFLYDEAVYPTALAQLGADRVLFGSDYPLLPASRVMAQAQRTLPADQLRGLLHDNAAHLLGQAS